MKKVKKIMHEKNGNISKEKEDLTRNKKEILKLKILIIFNEKIPRGI